MANMFRDFDDAGRKRLSWATELCAGIINAFPSAQHNYKLLNELALNICENPSGGLITLPGKERSVFVWGNVRSLTPDLASMISSNSGGDFWNPVVQRNLIPIEIAGFPRIVIHSESWTTISPSIWKDVESKGFKLSANLEKAWKSLKKADIFVIQDDQQQVHGLSVKTGTGDAEVKLSQQSTAVTYNFVPNPFTLSGGLGIESVKMIDDLYYSIKESELYSENTALSATKFNKLNNKGQTYAVLKYNYPQRWQEMIQAATEEALNNLKEFSKAFSGIEEVAAKNLQEILRHRLAGGSGIPGYYELWLSGYKNPINLTALLNNKDGFSSIKKLEGNFRKATGGGIDSLLVVATSNDNEQYLVSKVQPAFDGWQKHVSQTKGIIYYFQEGRQLHMPTAWDLIEDSCQ